METSASTLPRLWKPNHIFWIGFCFGWPGAIVLASINWLRIGRHQKAAVHLVGGLALTVAYTAGVWLVPDRTRLLPLLINILILYYLKERLDRDLPPFSAGLYRAAGIGRGILICVGMLVIYLAGVFVVAIGLALFEVGPQPPIAPEDPGAVGRLFLCYLA